ncbi:lipase family protein [Myroides pelagicus]|uniref:Lipase family protein n=1 Tax=Myroides pelagicus TaxID=270914 RepID=A0A7K1GIR6_9FLAO|nr:lipase family protein [Myroides pelagicus]MTH28353.1 lipase family protein [Myroides pelagicus]
MKINSLLATLLLFFSLVTYSQQLKPSFDKQEVIHSLELAKDLHKSFAKDTLYTLTNYTRIYESKELGLTNKWALYKNDQNIYEIAVRGSVNKGLSWMANYYAAMIPAEGTLKLETDKIVNYRLSDDPRAGTHAGWTVATLYLLEDIQPKLDSIIATGAREVIISGHSQGAAIAYLLTAAINQQKALHQLPSDLIVKTYAIAPPKPGNLYFNYSYEATTRNWSYSVINTLDWVPEVPPTAQMLTDFNEISPFAEEETNAMFKKISWPKRWFAQGLFKGLKKPSKKAVHKYNKYLGSFIFKQIKKDLPHLEEPTYMKNANYHRVGNPVILQGINDQEYMDKFNTSKSTMTHHNPPAYLYLINKYL